MFWLVMPLTATEGIDIAQLVSTSMQLAGITTAERLMFRGHEWDLRRLARLHQTTEHMAFWQIFLGKLASALITRSFTQVLEPFRVVRSKVATRDQKGWTA